MSVFRAGTNKSSVNNFPSVRPTLDLDFANTKTLDPRINFTRASGGSYVGADGLIKYAGVNEARFDHDPTTGESLGLLVEEGRTNLLLRSEEFGDSYWNKVRSIVNISSTTSPNGTLTATKLYPNNDATNNQHLLTRIISGLPDNTIYTSSIFIKKFGSQFSWCRLTFRSKTGDYTGIYFNYDTKTFGTFFGSQIGGQLLKSVGYQEYPDGWIRLYIVTNTSTGAATPEFILWIAENDNDLIYNYTGGDSDGFYIWGAQLEAGAFPTSYIPTQGSTRTRAADSALITGKNFSDFYNQSEGTVFVEFNLNTSGSTARLFNIDDGTSANRISGVVVSSTQYQTFIIPPGRGPTISNFPSTFKFKLSSAHKDYNTVNYLNNRYSNLVTGQDIIIPKNLNTFRIGNWQSNTFQGTTISKLTYYPKRLPNQQLIALTR